MPNEVRIDARRDFTRRVLPWLVTVAMLTVYALTLNHWVSLSSVSTVARVSGWLWSPAFNSPLYYLVTLPLRMLPVATIPVALNIFSATCAAFTLGLLARSVGLLPHDRTEAQQLRERNDFFLLTIRSAWFPPLLAALLCGWQLTFWEMSTNGGNETFDLLLFALVVWLLVEYRLDGRVWRLYSSAVVVGAGIMEGQSMTGFFPLYIVAVIWVRGLAFFNVQFLLRMFLYGLAGFSLFLIYPLATAASHSTFLTFWDALRFSLAPQIQVFKIYFWCVSDPTGYFEDLLVPLFIALMPLLVMSIRWKFGDSSRVGSTLANLMFHTIHAIFLAVCLWVVFDPPFSPRVKGFGLTLYYLIALSAGYYAGYFLLVFGSRRPRGNDVPPFLASLLNKAVVIAIWLAGILAAAGLFYKNAPLVQAANDDTLGQYTTLIIKNLPPKGGLLMCDDPERLYLVQTALARDGRAKDYLLLNTRSLLYPQYHRYLHKICPQKWPLLVTPQQTNTLNVLGMIDMMAVLSQSNEVYYLNPASYGYYFEEFYPEPHGLIYKLKPLPDDTLLPPLPDKNLIAENNAFWESAQNGVLSSVADALAPPDPHATQTFAQQILGRLHVAHEQNVNAVTIGAYCSRSLNLWGVQLQRADDLTDAGIYFRKALLFNPDNVVAQVNLRVNQELSDGHRPTVDFSEDTAGQLGEFDKPVDAVREDGPFDEPTLLFEYAYALAQEDKLFRQAVAPLKRVLQFDPNFWPAREWLARVYAFNRLPNLALAVLKEPLERPRDFSLDDSNSRELYMLASAAYFQQNKLAEGTRLLEMEVSRNATNETLLTTVEQIYVNRGMFSNALGIVDRRLLLTPNDPDWLFTRGYLYNQLKRYDDAIATLNSVLALQKDDVNALFQRANAYLGNGNLEAARADFEKLRQSQTNSFQIVYDLGDIAWRQHDTNEAIRNFEIYLAHSPTNTPQAQTVIERLHELKMPAGGK
jgi:tetratricopeptide (TPR) repeat protein